MRKSVNSFPQQILIIQTLSSTKSSLAIQLEDSQRESSDLNGQVRALHKAQRKSHRKLLLFQAALEEAEVKARSSEHYLKSVVRMVRCVSKINKLNFKKF